MLLTRVRKRLISESGIAGNPVKIMITARRAAIPGATMLLPVLFSACVGVQYTPIDVRDYTATVLSADATWHPWKKQAGPVESGEHGFELRHIRMEGKDSTVLAAGETMALNGSSLSGPQDVEHRVDVTYTHLAYSATSASSNTGTLLDLDAHIGIGRVTIRLKTSGSVSGPDVLRTRQQDYGLSMGLGARWRLDDTNALQARFILFSENPLSYFAGSFRDGSQADFWQVELAWVLAPAKNMNVRAGYSVSESTPKTRPNQSSLEAKLNGPFLGLGFLF